MSLSAAVLAALVAEGLDGAALVRVAQAAEAEEAARQEARKAAARAGNAERQRRFKANRKASSRADGNAGNAGNAVTSPPNDIYSNPPLEPDVSNETSPLAQQKTDEVEQAVEIWNAMARQNDLPAVRGKLSGSRRARLRARLAEHGLDGLRQAVAAVAASPFCRGEVNGFRADIGFLSRPDNFAKLLEGGFAPRQTSPPVSSITDYQRIAEEARARRSQRAA